jgi:hypothetical protein
MFLYLLWWSRACASTGAHAEPRQQYFFGQYCTAGIGGL